MKAQKVYGGSQLGSLFTGSPPNLARAVLRKGKGERKLLIPLPFLLQHASLFLPRLCRQNSAQLGSTQFL